MSYLDKVKSKNFNGALTPVKIEAHEQVSSNKSEIEEALDELPYEFRVNSVTGGPEFRGRHGGEWRAIDDYKLNSIVRVLRADRIRSASRDRVANVLNSDYAPLVNPVEKWFTDRDTSKTPSIAQIVEEHHVKENINALAATVTTDTPDLWVKHLTKWLVGTVANLFEKDRCANHLVLILVGEQGTYKSTFIRRLCPPGLEKYYREGDLKVDKEDDLYQTTANLIYNLDDYFGGISKRKIGEFKGLITQSRVKTRRPYDRYFSDLPKIASFIASSNEVTFLHDMTGNRRFIPIQVTAIDIEAAKEIDMEEVWMEAYNLYRDKFKYWMDHDDQIELQKHNARFEVQSAELEALVTFTKPADRDDETAYTLTNTEILRYLEEKARMKLSSKRLGEALRKMGYAENRFQKRMTSGKRGWVYPIHKLSDYDVNENFNNTADNEKTDEETDEPPF